MNHIRRFTRMLCIPLWAVTRRWEEWTTRVVYDRQDCEYQVQRLLPLGWYWVVYSPYSAENAWSKYAQAFRPVSRRYKVLR